MSEAVRQKIGDRERLTLAVFVALLIHTALVLLIPSAFVRELPDFEPPLYIEFEPIAGNIELPVETVAPEPPEALVERELVTEIPDANAAAPAPASPPAPAPVAERELAAPAVETEPPPPTRSIDREALRERASTDESRFVAEQLESYYEFQRDWIASRDAYAARSDGTVDTIEEAPDESELARELESILTAIRTTARDDPSFVDLGEIDPPNDVARDRGDGSGVQLGEGGRYRIAAGTLNLVDLELPVGFPVDYPLLCRVRVNAAGVVIAATIDPPSPSFELNRRVTAWIETWRFEEGTGIAEASFLIPLTTQ